MCEETEQVRIENVFRDGSEAVARVSCNGREGGMDWRFPGVDEYLEDAFPKPVWEDEEFLDEEEDDAVTETARPVVR